MTADLLAFLSLSSYGFPEKDVLTPIGYCPIIVTFFTLRDLSARDAITHLLLVLLTAQYWAQVLVLLLHIGLYLESIFSL